jgi:hypothetical protein
MKNYRNRRKDLSDLNPDFQIPVSNFHFLISSF